MAPHALQPKDHLIHLPSYVAAAHDAGASSVLLAANESLVGPSARAVEAYLAALTDIRRYPQNGAGDLRDAIAGVTGFRTETICCGHGSEELISLIARAFAGPGDEVVCSQHAFPMFKLAVLAAGATPVTADEVELTTSVDNLLDVVGPRTRILFLANPNNPTGTRLPRAEIVRLHRDLPSGVLLVLDAAYAEYIDDTDYASGHELVAGGAPNVVVLRTFSKIHGLAGLRVGWMHAPRSIVQIIDRLRGVYNVSTPAARAAAAAISDQEHITRSRALNRMAVLDLEATLSAVGVRHPPSSANFVLADLSETPGGPEAMDQAFRRAGILVQRCAGAALPSCLRISTGTGPEQAAVRTCLEAFLRP